MRAALRRLAILFAAATAVAQPPVAPDSKPETISPEALSEAIGGPSRVSLSFDNARPEEIVRALVAPVGIALDGYASTDLLKKMPPTSISISDQPFTVALTMLAKQLGVSFTLKHPTGFDAPASGMTLQLQKSTDPQMQMAGPILTRGPFVVIATALERRKTVALEENGGGENQPITREEATLEFVVLADPKLRQHGAYGAPKFADAGPWRIRPAENEAPWDARARNQGPPFLEWRYKATCELAADAQQTPPLTTTATGLLVTTKTEQWEIEDPLAANGIAKEVPLEGGKRRYEITEIRAAAAAGRGRQQAYDVVLNISGVGIDKGRWSGWPALPADVVIDSFRLVDGDGADYTPLSWEMKGGTLNARFDNSKGRRAAKPASGPPAKAIWKLPVQIRAAEIPVEFPSLALP